MQLHHHTVLSLASAGLVYLLSSSLSAALACFLSGVFIDLDHLLEYFYYFGFQRFSVREFFWAADEHVYRKFFLFLHSYELAVVFWILSLAVIRRPWSWGFSLGFTLHILADQIYNPCCPATYFLSFRIFHRFEGEKIFPLKTQKQYRERPRFWKRNIPLSGEDGTEKNVMKE
jgi:hypothetical protein